MTDFTKGQDPMKIDTDEKFGYLGFADPVHGFIKIRGRLGCLIHTKEFQRLRNIKQLSAVQFVYPTAHGNRFEHCLGVCHLAQQLLDRLIIKQPELKITVSDYYSVSIAALLHDVGHGPLSHFYELAVERIFSEKKFKHEKKSIEIIEKVLKYDSVKQNFEGILNSMDKEFISEMVLAKDEDQKQAFSLAHSNYWPYKGRDKTKSFLYEIIGNSISGIDMDKVDYIQRDCLYLAVNTGIQWLRCLETVRICKDKKTNLKRLAFSRKVRENLNHIIYTRRTFHIKAYKHKRINIVNEMLIDSIRQCYKDLKYGDKNLLTAHENLETFVMLDDSFLQRIQFLDFKDTKEPAPSLIQAQSTLNKIIQREMLTYCGHARMVSKEARTALNEDLLAKKEEGELNGEYKVVTFSFDKGLSSGNSLEKIPFYSKTDPENCEMESYEDKPKIEEKVLLFCAEKDIAENYMKVLKDICNKPNRPEWLGMDNYPNIQMG